MIKTKTLLTFSTGLWNFKPLVYFMLQIIALTPSGNKMLNPTLERSITVLDKGHRAGRQKDAKTTCRSVLHLICNSVKGNCGTLPSLPREQ